MILFVGEGRLGNQVFQYVAIRTLMGDGPLWTSGLGSLGSVFEPLPGLHHGLGGLWIEPAIRRILVPAVVRPLFKHLRIGEYCYEPFETMGGDAMGPSGLAVRTRGLLPLSFVDGGFYQNLSNLLSPSAFRRLQVRRDVLDGAHRAVSEVTRGGPWPQAVMHVRLGDYLSFRAYGLDRILLPEQYYQRAVERAREFLGSHAPILVVTDDPDWCRSELARLEPIHVVSTSEAVDFALLSMFPVAILSNSTFSLAAACVGLDVQTVIGPEFWFGHAVGQWYPAHIRSHDERFVYV